jgi:integrase
MGKKRRRRDGIYFRNWDKSWYSNVSGKQSPLRDQYGAKIKGRHNESLAQSAYHQLALAVKHRDRSHDGVTLGNVVIDYMRFVKHRRSPSSLKNAKWALEDLLTHLGTDRRIDEITDDEIARWEDQANNRLSPNSRRLMFAVVKACFHHAVKVMRCIQQSPVKELSRPASTTHAEIFTDNELRAVLTTAAKRFRQLCFFLNETGCRPGEAAKLEAKHFRDNGDHGECILAPNEHKTGRVTGKHRHIFLSQKATAQIRQLIREHPTGLLFTNNRGTRWTTQAVAEAFERLRIRTGINPKLTTYSFRHTFATRHIDAGVPIARVATWLGDSVATVERYYWYAIHKANKNLYTGLDNAMTSQLADIDVAATTKGSDG